METLAKISDITYSPNHTYDVIFMRDDHGYHAEVIIGTLVADDNELSYFQITETLENRDPSSIDTGTGILFYQIFNVSSMSLKGLYVKILGLEAKLSPEIPGSEGLMDEICSNINY